MPCVPKNIKPKKKERDEEAPECIHNETKNTFDKNIEFIIDIKS